MSTSDLALLDTNILVYGHQTLSPFHRAARSLLNKGLEGQELLCICPQVLLEFFAVITNPRRVTRPVSHQKAAGEVEKYMNADKFHKLHPTEGTFSLTIDLAKKHSIAGPDIFDAQIVATMLSNGVKRLYTYNLDHFRRFIEIVVLTP